MYVWTLYFIGITNSTSIQFASLIFPCDTYLFTVWKGVYCVERVHHVYIVYTVLVKCSNLSQIHSKGSMNLLTTICVGGENEEFVERERVTIFLLFKRSIYE